MSGFGAVVMVESCPESDEMTITVKEIEASFDVRANDYDANVWHDRVASRLVTLSQIREGACVLDAATGTGFVALKAVQWVGETGLVMGIDISSGMLEIAQSKAVNLNLPNLVFRRGDVVHLSDIPSAHFDVVLCAAGLLYMPVDEALLEWRRLLRPDGLVGFSTMRQGSPPAANVFRACAARFGVELEDPSAPLGTESRCRAVLEETGFSDVRIIAERIEFSTEDHSSAWLSNIRSPVHARVLELSHDDLDRMERLFRANIERLVACDAQVLRFAEVLYAFGRKDRD
jgi:ubiquinone/menaquinone biosynthesis C-methylase UbiE